MTYPTKSWTVGKAAAREAAERQLEARSSVDV